MAAAAETNHNRGAATKLLITSIDCDPKAELSLSDEDPPLNWDKIVDALNHANYCFAMRRLPTPPRTITDADDEKPRIAYLSLQASKKVAFFYHANDVVHEKYQISYDENLMNDLPSHRNLKGLPRFHLFDSLPEDMRLSITELAAAGEGGAARLSCADRLKMRILEYWNDRRVAAACYFAERFFRLVSVACFVAVVYVGANHGVHECYCCDDECDDEVEGVDYIYTYA